MAIRAEKRPAQLAVSLWNQYSTFLQYLQPIVIIQTFYLYKLYKFAGGF
jgi:hypothetical protein